MQPLLGFALLLSALLPSIGFGGQDDTSSMGELLCEVNRYRLEKNLPPLQQDNVLDHLASAHSTTMAERNLLSHAGFKQRFTQSGSRLCLENVGWNSSSPAEQVADWRSSSGHDRNLRDPRITRAGVAAVDGYVTFLACD